MIDQFARVSNLLQVEPSGDAKTVKITFDILMRKNMEPSEFSQQIAELDMAKITVKRDFIVDCVGLLDAERAIRYSLYEKEFKKKAKAFK